MLLMIYKEISDKWIHPHEAAVRSMNKNRPRIILCSTECHYNWRHRILLSAGSIITKLFFWLWKMKLPPNDLERFELRGKLHLKILGLNTFSGIKNICVWIFYYYYYFALCRASLIFNCIFEWCLHNRVLIYLEIFIEDVQLRWLIYKVALAPVICHCSKISLVLADAKLRVTNNCWTDLLSK